MSLVSASKNDPPVNLTSSNSARTLVRTIYSPPQHVRVKDTRPFSTTWSNDCLPDSPFLFAPPFSGGVNFCAEEKPRWGRAEEIVERAKERLTSLHLARSQRREINGQMTRDFRATLLAAAGKPSPVSPSAASLQTTFEPPLLRLMSYSLRSRIRANTPTCPG